jgi:ATP-dependent RNA helicase RhlE
VSDSVSVESFANLGIAPKLFAVLTEKKFIRPTPIQAQSIPPAIQGKDLMGIAQTGTGKTLAFGIPMIQRIAQSGGKKKGLVILPTRELALQVDETLRKIGGSLGLRTAIFIGGESMQRQLKLLRNNPHVIIATPGRLLDHMDNGRLNLSQVAVLVLDEADRMLDMGFAPQIKKILEKVPKERQTMLFSATMPDDIVKIAQGYMRMPLRVEVAPAGTAVKTVTQELFFVEKNQKLSLLNSLLNQYKGSVLVFSRTKHGARKITMSLKRTGFTAAEIHSNRSLGQRLEALNGFKQGKYRVMVATDIAARGIDVTGIELVINYDLPATADDYVHRIGRTGRAGRPGHAISFATSDQRADVKSIERLIRKTLAVSKLPPGLATAKPVSSRPQPKTAIGELSFIENSSTPRQHRNEFGSRFKSRRELSHANGHQSQGADRRPGRQEHGRTRRRGSEREFAKQRNTRGGFSREKESRTRRQDIPSLRRKPYQGEGFFIARPDWSDDADSEEL